jgi:hypothetical protein
MRFLGLEVTRNERTAPKAKWGRRSAVVAIGSANAFVLLGGVAMAFWSTTGSGTGASASGAAQSVTFTQTTTNANVLYPGVTGDVVLLVSNPNPFPVSVDSLTLPATAATSYTDVALNTLNATCNSGGTGVGWTYPTKTMGGVIVAKKVGATNGTLTLTLTGGATMTNLSDNACQSSFFKMANVTTATVTSASGTPVSTISQ